MMTPSARFGVGVVLVGLSFAPSVAEPCSILPGPQVIIPPNRAPASLPGIYLSGSTATSSVGLPNTQLYVDSSTTPLASHLVPAPLLRGYFLVPDAPLTEGTLLRIEATNLSRSLLIEQASPLPLTLGPLVAEPLWRGQAEVTTSDGSCVRQAEVVSAEVLVSVPPEWRNALYYTTKVDGQPYHQHGLSMSIGRSAQGAGVDRIFVICEDGGGFALSGGVRPGEHVVTMEAVIPGTSTVLTSDPLTITLSCDATPQAPNLEGTTNPGLETEAGCGCTTSPRGGMNEAWILGFAIGLRRRASARS
jgi:hypothetical protein